MLQRYKEILYGVLFGVGAVLIDTVMHSRMEGRSVWIEFVQPDPAMISYRVLFLLLGLALGWLLWQKNRRERDFRHLVEAFERFHRDLGAPALLMHTRLQVLLTRQDFQLSGEVEEAVRFVYEKSQEIQALTRAKLPAGSNS